jgi:putative transposase
MFKKSISSFDLIKKYVKKFKKQANYSSLQQTIRRLDKAYAKFFKKSGGFPRYKKLFKTIEYSKYGDGCKLSIINEQIYLQNIGKIKVIIHRKPQHNIKTLSLTCKNNQYYVNIICETPIYINDISKNLYTKAIGIDFGIKNIITTSDNLQISTPKPLAKKLKELSKLSKKKKYKALNKVYTKVSNIRKDFNHKLSRKLVDKYDCLCLEDISTKDWLTNIHNINRSIADINIGQLINFIVYKAESAGKQVVFVPPYNTTKICSKCGKTVNKTIKERIHKCSCGFVCDRDLNASYNILRLGLQSLPFG